MYSPPARDNFRLYQETDPTGHDEHEAREVNLQQYICLGASRSGRNNKDYFSKFYSGRLIDIYV